MRKNKSMLTFTLSMVIFGSVGIFRKYIPLPSGVIAMLRGYIGALFLIAVMFIGRKKLSREAIRQNFLLLCLSGAVMGANWILLFEAYNRTTVATATLCYYMAPVFVIFASPLIGEKLTARKLVCAFLALAGMVLVSGVTGSTLASNKLDGVLFGLGAAALYAALIILNKLMKPMPAFDRTVIQLTAAGVVLHGYCAISGQLAGLEWAPLTLVMLAVVCVVHTGVAYALYFGSIQELPANIIAVFSYIDPVVAVLLSALILREGLTLATVIGAVLILGGTLLSSTGE